MRNIVRMNVTYIWLFISFTIIFFLLYRKHNKYLKIFLIINIIFAIILLIYGIKSSTKLGSIDENENDIGILKFLLYYKNYLGYFHLFIAFICFFSIFIIIIVIYKINEFKNKFYIWILIILLLLFSLKEIIPNFLGCIHMGYFDIHKNISIFSDDSLGFKCLKEYNNYIRCTRH